MTAVDYFFLSIIAISILLSLLRGFVREALSLAGWVAAVWVALGFSGSAAQALGSTIETPALRAVAAFVGLFVFTLIAASIASFLASRVVRSTGLGGTDRMLGVAFGTVRGCLIVAVLVMLAGFMKFPEQPWWQESALPGYFQPLADWLCDFLPANIAGNSKA